MRLKVASQVDVEQVRRTVRAMACSAGFGVAEAEALVLAASELATNLVRHTSGGQVTVSAVNGARGSGLQIESEDTGPGIVNLGLAMQDGFSTRGGLGSGLPGVRRLTDEFEIRSGPSGTTVVARKWPRQG